MSESDRERIDNPNGSRQIQQLRAKQQLQLRNISRASTTRIYAEQLAPLYPLLSKTQVRAALVLTDNNMHECRLILDMKCKFAELKNSFKLPRLQRRTTADGESNLDARKKGLKINKERREVVERCERMGSVEKNEKKCEDVEESRVISSSSTSTSFSSIRSSVSNVYDFSDSESCIESTMEWFGKRRNNANRRVVSDKKVGVIITKSQSGYRAYPL